MKRVILKFNIFMLTAITLLWIFTPALFPQLSKVWDCSFCRVQVGIYNTFTVSANAEDESSNKIALTFDDGYKCVYTTVYPLLSDYGYTASIPVIGNRIGQYGYLNYKELSILYRNGCEMLNHSYSHFDGSISNKQEILREYKLNRMLLTLCGFSGGDIIVSPYGKFTKDCFAAITDEDYTAVRTLKKFYTGNEFSTSDISIINIYNKRPIDDIKMHIDTALDSNQNIILIFHKVYDNPPSSPMYISTDKFTEILDYIQKKNLSVVSYRELIETENN